MLARALLHARLVAERNHARREALVLEATRSNEAAIDARARGRIAALSRRLARSGADDAATREALADEIAALIEREPGPS